MKIKAKHILYGAAGLGGLFVLYKMFKSNTAYGNMSIPGLPNVATGPAGAPPALPGGNTNAGAPLVFLPSVGVMGSEGPKTIAKSGRAHF